MKNTVVARFQRLVLKVSIRKTNITRALKKPVSLYYVQSEWLRTFSRERMKDGRSEGKAKE
jgi:hypothetical protein